MRILVVEKDDSVAQSIELMLRTQGFSVDIANLAGEAMDLGRRNDYDLITLELKLPDMNGLEVLKVLRANDIATPIIILTSVADIDNKVACLESGADDYITKPFQAKELLARISAVIRRSAGRNQSISRFGNVSIDTNQMTVQINGVLVNLAPQEYKFFLVLFSEKNKTVAKEKLMRRAYTGSGEPYKRTVEVAISRIRKKLEENNATVRIDTARHADGYALRETMASSF